MVQVLDISDRYVLLKADSGTMRFQIKAPRNSQPEFLYTAKRDPQKKLYRVSLGHVCKVTNLQEREEPCISQPLTDIHFDDFFEFWVTWYNNKIKIGFAGQQDPLLIYKYCMNEVIGYVMFDTKHYIQWKFEEPPIVVKPMPCKIFDEKLTWVEMSDGQLPPDALIGGFEKGPIYVARANLFNSLIPGKYVPECRKTFVPWGDNEHSTMQFEILCGHNAKWVKTKGNHIPPDAFVAGYSEVRQEPLYVGRAMHDKCLLVGKVHVLYKACYLPYYNREITVSSYEILTCPKVAHHVPRDV